MNLSREVFLESLKFGLVVRYAHPDFPEKEHFFVIVDYSPNKIPPMISLISSKSNKHKETYVQIEKDEYNFFTKQSFIDCDQVYEKTPDDLYKLFSESRLSIQGTFEQQTLERIKDKCYNSKQLAKIYRKRIVQAYNKAFE